MVLLSYSLDYNNENDDIRNGDDNDSDDDSDDKDTRKSDDDDSDDHYIDGERWIPDLHITQPFFLMIKPNVTPGQTRTEEQTLI